MGYKLITNTKFMPPEYTSGGEYLPDAMIRANSDYPTIIRVVLLNGQELWINVDPGHSDNPSVKVEITER